MAGKRKRSAASQITPAMALSASPAISGGSKRLREELAEEDARILQLERKLGLKKGKVPKSFKVDGWDDLLGELGGDEPDNTIAHSPSEAEYHQWLTQKRQQTPAPSALTNQGHTGLVPDDENDRLLQCREVSDAGSTTNSIFNGFDSESDTQNLDTDEAAHHQKTRENPYIPPTHDVGSTKYVPPSLRGDINSKDSTALKRQLQGYLNRLTESNLHSIIKDVEKIYASQARGQVTASLVYAIMAQVSSTATLSDSFFVLHGGFVAALYKTVGESFASHIVTRVVADFRHEYLKASSEIPGEVGKALSKMTSNLVTFIAELYVFQVIACNLIFDLVRLFTNELSELNTELLLRVVRMAGKHLRKDDPQALKDVAGKLQSLLVAADRSRITERTRFMADMITDLKNNKPRAGLQESAIITSHVTAIKKLLGSLNPKRSAPAGPLRIGLQDIDESGSKGKWWLIGASYGGPSSSGQTRAHDVAQNADSSGEDEDLDRFFPDYGKAAKEQGLKTESQQAIFAAIAGGCNPNDAVSRFHKLNLGKNQRREVAFVLLQSAGAEQPYNPYYALVARKLCSDGRIRFAFQDQLWQVFRQLGESVFDDEGNEDQEDETFGQEDTRIANVGRLVGTLLAHSALSLKTLKCLDLPMVKPKTALLLEYMLIAVFKECQRIDSATGKNTSLERCFRDATTTSTLAAGLHFLLGKLGKSSRKPSRVKKGDVLVVRDGCKFAQEFLKSHALTHNSTIT